MTNSPPMMRKVYKPVLYDAKDGIYGLATGEFFHCFGGSPGLVFTAAVAIMILSAGTSLKFQVKKQNEMKYLNSNRSRPWLRCAAIAAALGGLALTTQPAAVHNTFDAGQLVKVSREMSAAGLRNLASGIDSPDAAKPQAPAPH